MNSETISTEQTYIDTRDGYQAQFLFWSSAFPNTLVMQSLFSGKRFYLSVDDYLQHFRAADVAP